MLKLALLLLTLLPCAVCSAAYPSVAFGDLAEAIVVGAPGETSFSLAVSNGTWQASITRSLARRLDVTATAAPDDLFDLGARVLVVKDLLPLHVAVDISLDRVSLFATLLLGPVHVDYGRTWGTTDARFGYVQYAPSQTLTILIGLRTTNDRPRAIVGVRVHPVTARLWGASLVVIDGALRFAIGGTLR